MGPVPNGFAFKFPVFQRAMRLITNISNGFPATVTTSFNHNYLTGDIVRLIVPLGWGMTQANTLFGTITVVTPTSFTIDIDTTFFNPFVTPPNPSPHIVSVAQAIPIGEIAYNLRSATRNVLLWY